LASKAIVILYLRGIGLSAIRNFARSKSDCVTSEYSSRSLEVSENDGSHVFSENLEDHERALQAIDKKMQQKSLKR
jgi:hypothetical protein